MGNVLVIAEERGGIPKATLSAIGFGRAAAQRLGGTLHVAVLGKSVAGVAAELAKYGATVHAVEHETLTPYLAEPYTQAVTALAKAVDAELVVAAATTRGKDLMPRVAAALDAGMASDVVAQVDKNVFKQPMWAGNAIAEVELLTAKKVVTIRATEFAPAEPGSAGEVKKVSPAIDAAAIKTKFVAFAEVKSTRPQLTEARIVVSGGRGVKSPDGYKQTVEALADTLKAATGASRAIVDAGWVPNDLQVGQTGKVVAPDLYIALGVSGAIQHVAGMKGSKTIVAVNTDPEADIFKIADYGLVMDLFKVVPELIDGIKKLAK